MLRGVEKLTVPLGEKINQGERLKNFAAAYGYHVSRPFVSWISQPRWRLFDEENMVDLKPPRGVLLVSNHRSFFDMYVAATTIFTHGDFIERLYFPVRSRFFYDNPFGPLVNALMSGFAMWPPVFRDERKESLNAIGLEQMAYALSEPGAVLGIHPEGTRQKGDDPYILGVARPGVGRLIQRCHPETLVLPFFILGPGNDLLAEVRRRIRGETSPEIRMHWGKAIPCEELQRTARSPEEIASELLLTVHDLGQRDRRARLRVSGKS